MAETKEPTAERVQVLLTEYEQIQERKRTYLRLLIEIVLIYLALTGVAVDYALREPGLTLPTFLAAAFDVLVGAFGSSVMFVARKQMRRTSVRLEEICSLLTVYYEGSSIIEWAVWAILACYLFVVGMWGVIFLARLVSIVI